MVKTKSKTKTRRPASFWTLLALALLAIASPFGLISAVASGDAEGVVSSFLILATTWLICPLLIYNSYKKNGAIWQRVAPHLRFSSTKKEPKKLHTANSAVQSYDDSNIHITFEPSNRRGWNNHTRRLHPWMETVYKDTTESNTR